MADLPTRAPARLAAGVLGLGAAGYAAWASQQPGAAVPTFTVLLAGVLFAHSVVLLTPRVLAPGWSGPAFLAYGFLLALVPAAAFAAGMAPDLVLVALGLGLIVAGETLLQRTHPFRLRRGPGRPV